MEAIIPYLNFNGNASDALKFYTNALNGKVEMSQTFGDAQMEMPETHKDKILHAVFTSGDLKFMVSDCPPNVSVSSSNSLSLSMNFNDVDEMNKVYAALSDDGKITMELQDTFWGARFGMLIDKYGFNWMFNHDYKK
ncbi:MAG: VOC family protein [Ginsengibacter sp.]